VAARSVVMRFAKLLVALISGAKPTLGGSMVDE